MSAKLIVRIKESQEPLLVGLLAEITSFDFIPFAGDASEANPLINMTIIDSGFETTGRLSQVELVKKEITNDDSRKSVPEAQVARHAPPSDLRPSPVAFRL